MTNTESINPPESQTTDADTRLNEKLFADQCLDLLCKQEKTLWLLGQANEKAQNDESLELIWQMLIQFLDFAEKHFNKEEFASIADPLHEVHACTADHKQKLNTHAWKLVRSMIGLESPGENDIRDSYLELGRQYVDLFDSFFEVCQRKFSSPSPDQETFDEAVNVFLGELREKW